VEVVLHGNLRRLGDRVRVEAKTPREALLALGVDPEAEEWILVVGDRVVGLDERVEGPLEVYPPIAGGWYTEAPA